VDQYNHCLAGDTRVETLDGSIAIRKLVGKTGWLHTSIGVRPFTHVWSSGLGQLFRVQLADGTAIRATAKHPFLTRRGWVNAGDLTTDDEVLSVAKCLNNQKSWFSTGSATLETTGGGITEPTYSLSALLAYSIEQCGKPRTALSRLAGRFTTGFPTTSTLLIPRALKFSSAASTNGYTARAFPSRSGSVGDNTWSRPSFRLSEPGKEQQKADSAWSKTVSATVAKLRNGYANYRQSCFVATGAATNSPQRRAMAKPGFAPTTTRPRGDADEYVKVVSIVPDGVEEVFDLEVDDPCHDFAVNGGVIVSNSISALRYLWAAAFPALFNIAERIVQNVYPTAIELGIAQAVERMRISDGVEERLDPLAAFTGIGSSRMADARFSLGPD
jgi:hypothetical protein